jgi:hypothetical protein
MPATACKPRKPVPPLTRTFKATMMRPNRCVGGRLFCSPCFTPSGGTSTSRRVDEVGQLPVVGRLLGANDCAMWFVSMRQDPNGGVLRSRSRCRVSRCGGPTTCPSDSVPR